jgi:hypothetical protein
MKRLLHILPLLLLPLLAAAQTMNVHMKDGNVKMENGCVVFSGLDAGSSVSVYLQDGRLIKESKVDAGGNVIVELSGLPKGVLIIHSNKTDIKIINR